jgi:hypothetical protein
VNRAQQGGAAVDQKDKALVDAADLLGLDQERARQILSELWESAFERGRLEALDELQDRFCVCMK